ncbi:MAG: hypothetical protein IJ824_01280 [Alphaproteobacteria bacterium]|nr:hypothetical protein [Alphaproteobacteria bacterium]
MKKFIIGLLCFAFLCESVQAERKNLSYEEEMYVLGTVCGQGLACKSKKYHQFELLARAVVVGKATGDEQQKEGLQRYNAGKVDAFANMEAHNFSDCDVILSSFENQSIFKSVLYSDGRLKFPDGTLITPRRPYDASKLYVKDREAFIKADAMYKKYLAEAKKNMQNAPKIKLHDPNYARYSNE